MNEKVKNTIRIIGFLILASMLVAITCIPSGADLDTTLHSAFCTLHFSSVSDGILELTIDLESPHGICAMLCDLKYNPKALVYLSGGTDDANIHFKAIDNSGELSFLIDSNRNSAPRGTLVRLYFKMIGNGAPNLSLTCREDALYLDDRGEIRTAQLKITSLPPDSTPEDDLASGNPASGKPSSVAAPPHLLTFEIGNSEISFSVKTDQGFAAGMRLFLVELESGETSDVVVAGVVGKDGILAGKYRLEDEKSYSVVATPIAFYGQKTSKGEKITALILRQN